MCIRDRILPGVVVAFENPKGGVGKSTLTALFEMCIRDRSSPSGETPVKKDSPSPHAVHRYRKPGKGPGTLPVRISVEMCIRDRLEGIMGISVEVHPDLIEVINDSDCDKF